MRRGALTAGAGCDRRLRVELERAGSFTELGVQPPSRDAATRRHRHGGAFGSARVCTPRPAFYGGARAAWFRCSTVASASSSRSPASSAPTPPHDARGTNGSSCTAGGERLHVAASPRAASGAIRRTRAAAPPPRSAPRHPAAIRRSTPLVSAPTRQDLPTGAPLRSSRPCVPEQNPASMSRPCAAVRRPARRPPCLPRSRRPR